MSVRALAWAFEQPVDATAKLVLLALADHVSEDGVCWVGIRRLEQKTSLKERAVRAACTRLEALGLIRKSPRFQDGRQTTNLWEVAFAPSTPAPNAGGGGTRCRGEGAPNAGGRVHQMHPKNRQEEPSERTKTPPTPPRGERGVRVSADECEAIYQAYPRREAKGDAIKAAAKALTIAPFPVLLEAVQAYATATAKWPPPDRRYIPLPASWLNARRWEDDRALWVRFTPETRSPTRNAPQWNTPAPGTYTLPKKGPNGEYIL